MVCLDSLLPVLGFPFYTIGRFQNEVCTGKNNLYGTCMVRGECTDNGGVSAGGCSSVTSQAVCCICKLAGYIKPFRR